MAYRYLCTVVGDTKNRFRSQVGQDIREAFLEKPADAEGPAIYWSKEDQERKLKAAYQKWSDHGNVWSAASPAVCLIL